MKSSNLEKSGREVSCKIEGDTMCRSSLGIVGTMAKKTCPYGVPTKEIAMVQDVHSFLAKLLKNLEWKVIILEGEVKMFLKKLIGLHYNMDDHKALVVEAQEGFNDAQSRLKGLKKGGVLQKTSFGCTSISFCIVKWCRWFWLRHS